MSARIAGIMLWLLATLAASAQAQTVVEYVHTDALGSVVAVTNASRTVLERREYEPYGSQLTPAVSNGPGYTGHVQDAATGLVYMQQRYYDAQLGVFLSIDPVTANSGTGANFHRYRYANNNPYSVTDPDGRCGTHIEGRKSPDCKTIQVNPSSKGGASSDSASSQQASSREEVLSEATMGDPTQSPLANGAENVAEGGSVAGDVMEEGYKASVGGGILGAFLKLLRFARAAPAAMPDKVLDTLRTVQRTGAPPPGYVGGRVFKNFEGRLPAGGRYREYDVDPAPGAGGRRNAERLVIDENTGKAWYTDDHYGSFREIKL